VKRFYREVRAELEPRATPTTPSAEVIDGAQLRAAQAKLMAARAAVSMRPAGPPPVAPSAPRPLMPLPGALGHEVANMTARYRSALHARGPEFEAERQRLVEMESARKVRELRRSAADRGVPQHPRLLSVVFADRPFPTEALRIVEEALSWRHRVTAPGFPPPPLTLVLAGLPGVGKSTVLARTVARWSRSAFFVTARDVANLPENDWSENAQTRARLFSVELLAVDEAGQEDSRRAGARMEALLSERVNRARVTLVSTNLDQGEFTARYITDRLRSRLAVEQGRRGQPWWMDVDGEDLRDPAALAEWGASE
jgi:hypothetical protein